MRHRKGHKYKNLRTEVTDLISTSISIDRSSTYNLFLLQFALKYPIFTMRMYVHGVRVGEHAWKSLPLFPLPTGYHSVVSAPLDLTEIRLSPPLNAEPSLQPPLHLPVGSRDPTQATRLTWQALLCDEPIPAPKFLRK